MGRSAGNVLLSFPAGARNCAGCHWCEVQAGLGSARQEVADVRVGTNETRIRDESGICRVTNIAKFEEAIHVPYRFQKKTQVSCM